MCVCVCVCARACVCGCVCVQCAGVLECRMMLKGTTTSLNRVHASLLGMCPPSPPGRLLRPLSVFLIIWQSKCEHVCYRLRGGKSPQGVPVNLGA